MPERKPFSGELTVQKAAQLALASFEHSQGIPSLQLDLFSYFKVVHPTWYIQPEMHFNLEEILISRIEKLMKSKNFKHKDIGSMFIAESVAMVDHMRRAMNTKEIRDGQQLVTDIAKKTVSADYHYLVKQDGRDHSSKDPYFSYICHFAFNQQKGGISEFDELYRQTRNYLLDHLGPDLTMDGTQGRLEAVVNIFNNTHPEETVRLGSSYMTKLGL